MKSFTQEGVAKAKMVALFLLSVVSIAFQLSVMRSFSVGSWSTFGSMVISIALLGIGLAGTLLTFLNKRVRENSDKWLSWTAILQLPAMTFAHILAQKVPFNPVMMPTNPAQLWWIGAYYAIYAVPFFIGAIFISSMFISFSQRIHKLYFWNMVGSGAGGFFILLMMYIFKPSRLIIPLLIVGAIATILCYFQWDDVKKQLKKKTLIIGSSVTLTVALLTILSIFFWGNISVSQYKGISYAEQFPDGEVIHHSIGPDGEFHIFKSSFLHFAPGLSDTASLELDEMPKEAFHGMYIDGGGPIGIMRELNGEESKYIDYLPMTAPYILKENPKSLILQLGGGIGAFTALYHNSERVDVVEHSNKLIKILGEEEQFVDFNGDLLNDPKLTLEKEEPRSYCRTTDIKYDVIEMGLVDSVGLSSTGGYPISENYGYTSEGIRDYMSCLEDDGILSLTVWNRLAPPRNVPRLITTTMHSLEQQNVANPGEHIFVFSMIYSTATVLVKNSPFTTGEIEELRYFCSRMGFPVSYYPNMPSMGINEEEILAEYTKQYEPKVLVEGGGMFDNYEDQIKLVPTELYYIVTKWLVEGRADELYSDYVFDIRPATDSRPYYTGYLKLSNWKLFKGNLGLIPEEWGFVMSLATLGISVIFGLLIILIPMITRWKTLFEKKKGTVGILAYFSCLGFGYMFVEIFLIQKLVFFLSNPIYSTSIVITAMLIISGLGSLYASRFNIEPQKKILVAGVIVAITMIFYIFGLSPLLTAILGIPFATKLIVTIIVVAPSAFFMGMFFPTGLSQISVSRPGLLPWAWGVNGALSVTGTVLAQMFSLSVGFPLVLGCVIGFYLLAGVLFPSTMKR